jgi:hypothetical protein
MHKKKYMPFCFFICTHQEFLLPVQLNLCLYLSILDNLLLFKLINYLTTYKYANGNLYIISTANEHLASKISSHVHLYSCLEMMKGAFSFQNQPDYSVVMLCKNSYVRSYCFSL